MEEKKQWVGKIRTRKNNHGKGINPKNEWNHIGDSGATREGG